MKNHSQTITRRLRELMLLGNLTHPSEHGPALSKWMDINNDVGVMTPKAINGIIEAYIGGAQ